MDSRNSPKKFLSYVCTGFLKSFLSLPLKTNKFNQEKPSNPINLAGQTEDRLLGKDIVISHKLITYKSQHDSGRVITREAHMDKLDLYPAIQ